LRNFKAVGGQTVYAAQVVEEGCIAFGAYIVKDTGDGVGEGEGLAKDLLDARRDLGRRGLVGTGVEALEEVPGLGQVS
jgi:hypothetical protein